MRKELPKERNKVEEHIRWKYNENAGKGGAGEHLRLFTPEAIKKVRNFHQSISGYQPTPLRSLANLAKFLGVAGIYVKDESYRFGLNAFKALGATYAIGKYLAGHKSGGITFTTATDGNHGRGVAWAAAKLGHKAVIYMPRGTA
ncbi:pyridoxal-phosphate dependent enzyme, partial [bacterium]